MDASKSLVFGICPWGFKFRAPGLGGPLKIRTSSGTQFLQSSPTVERLRLLSALQSLSTLWCHFSQELGTGGAATGGGYSQDWHSPFLQAQKHFHASCSSHAIEILIPSVFCKMPLDNGQNDCFPLNNGHTKRN